MRKKQREKIRKLIWGAINNHFIVKNTVNLETDLKYEKNKTIAKVMAVGLSHQYHLDRRTTEMILCINRTGYDTKLKEFMRLTKDCIGSDDEDLKNWKHRLGMTSRWVRRNYKTYYEASSKSGF